MANILVTGASRGLGLGIARQLAGEGHCVIAVARTAGTELARLKGEVIFEPFDFERTEDIGAFVRRLRKSHGSILGLVNNAGIGTYSLLATMPEAQIERLLRINSLAPMLLTKHVVRFMMADGAGRIVNITSIVATSGFKGLPVYSATKASLEGFTRSLAREVGPLGITVNAVAPGFVETDLTGGMKDTEFEKIRGRSALRRMAEVEDVAHAVSYLLSDKARNVTGTVMTVDAGGTA
jgi:3-oxoacyl-[acyl-carrier protein] reductase